MSDMNLLEAARPDVVSLSDDERRWLRSQVFQEPSAASASRLTVTDVGAASVVLTLTEQGRPRSMWPARSLTVAAAVIVLAGLSGWWIAVRSDVPRDDPASTAPTSTAMFAPAVAPSWYQPIRSVLPVGFDQIVLTDASTQSLSFKAFRTGTLQLLDVVITWPGTDLKDTSDVVTFTDDRGDYYESTSAVTLITNDQRIVNVRCGLSPIGGGAVGSASMADSRRDYCGPGFDNLDLDPTSRRELAVRFADAFTSESSIAGFAQPTPPPSESPALMQQLAGFLGVPVEVSGEQARGVLRSVNLSNPVSTRDTELTVVHGIWPSQPADGASTYGRVGTGRFFHGGDVATALVVTADGTGYHLITTNLDADHLTRLGNLLDELAGSSNTPAPLTTDPATAVATSPDATTPAITTASVSAPGVPAGSALASALKPDGRVLIVNASGTDGLAGRFRDALEDNGYSVVDSANAADGVTVTQSAIYHHAGAPLATVNALSSIDEAPIPFGQSLHGQVIPGLTDDMLGSADIIVMLGTDLADAPWETATPPLIDQGVGELLVVDASTTPAGGDQVDRQIEQLRVDGVAIAAVVPATRAVEESMFMPLGGSTPWAFAVAELVGIGGFDAWTPSFIAEPVPNTVLAVLILGDE